MKARLKERLFERFQAPITLKYELPGGVIGEAIAKDISMEGARLKLPQRLDVDRGTRVRLEVQIPGRNRATIIVGEIIWRGEYGLGIRFIQVDPFDMEDIIAELRTKASPFVHTKSEFFRSRR